MASRQPRPQVPSPRVMKKTNQIGIKDDPHYPSPVARGKIAEDPYLHSPTGFAARGNIADENWVLSPTSHTVGDNFRTSRLARLSCAVDEISPMHVAFTTSNAESGYRVTTNSLGIGSYSAASACTPMIFHDRTPSTFFHPDSSTADNFRLPSNGVPISITSAVDWDNSAPSMFQPVKVDQSSAVTFMIRGVPNTYSRKMLLDEFADRNLRKDIDFFYLPFFPRADRSVGYCFVNLVNTDAANRCYDAFHGLKLTKVKSNKTCEVKMGKVQGLANNIEAYRDSAVITMSESRRPILLKDGEEIPFPLPTGAKSTRYPQSNIAH